MVKQAWQKLSHSLSKLRKKKLAKYVVKTKVLTALAILSIIAFGLLTLLPKKVLADWFDEAWLYRQVITLPTHSALENNVYFTVSVDTATLISAGKLQSDCGDLRFTKENGQLQPYYIASGCNSGSTSIQIFFDTYDAGVVSTYMYYGNTTVENGTAGSSFSTAASNNASSESFGSEETGPGPVAWWKFDNGYGTSAQDSSSFANTGTIAGAVWKDNSMCVFGSCLQFLGSNDTVTVTNATEIDFNDGLAEGFTFSLWARTNTDGEGDTGELFSKGTNTYIRTTNEGLDGYADLEVSLDLATTDATVSITNGVVLQAWQHIAVTYTDDADDEIKVYIDGELVAESSNGVGSPAADTNNLLIGGSSAANYHGFLDEFKIYAYEKSAQQINSSFVSGGVSDSVSARFGYPQKGMALSDGLAGYWKMDDSSGNMSDSSGNNKNLTNTNAATVVTGKYSRAADLESSSSQFFSTSTGGSISRIQSKVADGANPTATFDATPTQGNLLVAYVFSRSGTASVNHTISGSGWTKRIARDTQLGNSTYRRAMSVWTKNAGVSEPSAIQITGGDTVKLLIQEFAVSGGGTLTYEASASNDNGTTASATSLSTGTTSSVSGDKLLSISLLGAKRDGHTSGWSTSWSDGFSNTVSNGSDSFGRFVASAYKSDTISETKSSTGTISGGSTANSGLSAGILVFSTDAEEPSLASTHSIATWVRPESNTASTQYNIAGEWDAGSEAYLLAQYGDEVRMYVNSSSNYVTTTAANLATGTWYHVVGVYDAEHASAKIYINGVEQATTTTGTIPSAITNSGGLFHIGAANSATTANNFYDGLIDEVRLYNKAFSSDDVKSLYTWAPGPSVYYKFDEASGTTSIADSSTNLKTGTMNGSMTQANWVTGKFGSALDFDGVDDRISIATIGDGELDYGDMTITAWINVDSYSADEGIIVARYNDDFDRWWFRVEQDGSLSFIIDNDEDGCEGGAISGHCEKRTAAGTITTGEWYHVSAVFTQSDLDAQIFVNGVKIPKSQYDESALDGLNTGNDLISLGRRNDLNDEFDGKMDEVKIYNYARTPSQLIQDMNGGHPLGGSPVGSQLTYWKMDEGYGDFGYDSIGNSDIYLAGPDSCPGDSDCPTWTNDGKFNKALSFDGGDYMEASAIAAYDNNGTEPYTATIWFKSNTNPTNNYAIMGVLSNLGAVQDRFIQVTSSGVPRFYVYDGSERYATGTTDVVDDQWHHLAGVFDGDTIYIYVDGKLEGTQATTGSEDHTSPYIRFSHSVGGYYNHTVGQVDEAKIYTAALTAEEIQSDMNRGTSSVLGNTSTASDGVTPNNSAAREYCVPGDTTSCSAPTIHYRMDENTGTTTFYDVSGNNRHGTLGNFSESDWVPGKEGSGLHFDGSNNYTLTASPSLPTGDFTYSLWTKFEDVATGTYAGVIDTTGNEFTLLVTDGSLEVYTNGGYRVYTPDLVTVNEWSHVAVTRSGSTVSIYLDGKLQDSATDGTAFDFSTCQLLLGVDANSGCDASLSNYSDVVIDDFKVYDYARTPAQIAWDMNHGAPIAHYKLDECSGNTAYNSADNGSGVAPGLDGTLSIGATGSNDAAGSCEGDSSEAWANGETGKRNSSLSFDGTDDYINLGNGSDFECNTNTGFSISMWYKWGSDPSADNNSLIGRWASSSGRDWMLSNDYGGIRFSVATSATTHSDLYGSGIIQNQWYHVVATWDPVSDTQKIYIDGKLINSKSLSSCFSATGRNTLIGAIPSTPVSRYFNGQLDEVKYFRYPLTDNQVRSEYNEGAVTFR